MKKQLLTLILTLFALTMHAQQITVDNTTYNAQGLIENVLIEGPCANTSNWTSHTGNAENGIAYFEQNGSTFPFANGIILSSGNAMLAPGPSTPLASGTSNGGFDADLEAISGVTDTNDATYIEFDFTPTTNSISFNYLFVSEEYDQNFECTYSDIFAFILTDIGTGVSTNLAIIPGTTDPVTCTTVRPEVPGQCAAVNPTFFDHYNFDATDPTVAANSPIVYGGQTVPLIATSAVTPGNAYHIKLVLADQGNADTSYDSAVFLEGGSFSLGITLNLNGITIVNGVADICGGTAPTLDGTVNVPGVVYQWSLDGVEMTIANGFAQDETNPILSPTVSGNYSLNASIPQGGSGTCEDTESVQITFHTTPTIAANDNIELCDLLSDNTEDFTLTDNDSVILGTQVAGDHTITYHPTQADADANTNAIASPYTSTGEIVFARIELNAFTDCYATTSFNLVLNPLPTFPALINDYILCDDDYDNFVSTFDLTTMDATINQGVANIAVSYYTDNTYTTSIATPTAYTNIIAGGNTVFAQLENTVTNCISQTEFNVAVNPIPVITAIPDYELCDDNFDGFLNSFDLTTIDATATGGVAGISATYYTDNTYTTVIATPATYTNTTISGNVIFVQLENTTTNCISQTQFNVVVNPRPVLTSPVELRQCDDDTDGITAFNLTEANELLSVDYVNETFVFYTSLADAQANNNPIATPDNYVTGATTVFTSVTTTNGCVSYGQIDLIVGITQIPAAFQLTYDLCDDDFDGVQVFDFSNATPQVIALFPAGTPITVSYYENQADALAETNAIPNISNYTNATPNVQTVWIRVDSDDVNACLGLGEHITLTVNPLPENNSATIPAELIGCSDLLTADFDLDSITPDAVNGQANIAITYHTSQSNADNAINPLTSPYNTITNTIIYIRVENTITGCFHTLMNFELVVNPNPTINDTPTPIVLCDNDGVDDGFTLFDLTVRENEIRDVSTTGFSVTYFTAQADAIAGAGASLIADPTNFTNTINPQIIYVRVENDTTGCFNIAELTIEVNSSPQTQTLTPLYVCDGDNDGFVLSFDLHNPTTLAEVTGGNLYDVAFYETQAEADLAFPGSELQSPYANLSNPQIVFVRTDLGTTGCYAISQLELNVLYAPETPEFLTYTECDYFGDASDGIIEFDLTSYETSDLYTTIVANGGVATDYTTTYYSGLLVDGSPDLATAITSPYVNTVNDQIIYAVVTSNLNIDSNNNGCTSMTAITLHVDTPPSLLGFLVEVAECDDDTDGFFAFDLTSYYAQITNDNLNDLTITFYDNGSVLTTPFTVDPTSLITNPTAFTNAAAGVSHEVYVQLVNNITGCTSVALLTLDVNPLPSPLPQIDIDNMSSCVNDGNGPGSLQEGYAIFDFTDQLAVIQGIEQGVSLTFHTSEADANADINEITDIANFYNTTPTTQTIWVRDENDVTGCYVLVHFDINVPVPNISVSTTSDILCVDENGVPLTTTALPVISATTTSGLLADYTFQWYLNDVIIPGETNSTITVTQEGTYTVVMTDMQDVTTNHDDTLCINMDSTTITISAMPDDFEANVTTNAFAENQQILATATSSVPGVVFIYTLDGLEQNKTGIFDNVAPGSHIVTITDGKGCWSEDVAVFVIDYPKFFTPNGDGINDYWAINGQQGIPISQIFIFDRFGKLLKQLDPDSLGWDGSYNGNPMPATDYWFKIIYIEGPVGTATQKEFRAHFALKR